MEWNDLSMADRAKYIQLGVQNGITSLSDIRNTYNNYAEGGPKITLKSGKSLEYKEGQWYYDGKPRATKNFTIIGQDGYRRSLTPDGSLTIQDVDNNGNPIQHTYIGGSTREAREKYWEQAPIMKHATDSIAKRYNISPELLRDRMNHEGIVDRLIRINNEEGNRDTSNYDALNGSYSDGFFDFGLDDVATMIKRGDVNLINEQWEDIVAENEKGRTVNVADGLTTKDNIGIMAATLKYFRGKAAKDFPNSSNKFLDKAAGVYFNRGAAGGKKYMKTK